MPSHGAYLLPLPQHKIHNFAIYLTVEGLGRDYMMNLQRVSFFSCHNSTTIVVSIGKSISLNLSLVSCAMPFKRSSLLQVLRLIVGGNVGHYGRQKLARGDIPSSGIRVHGFPGGSLLNRRL